MQLAAYAPVMELIKRRKAHILVVSTMAPKYLDNFTANLGFDMIGDIVIDKPRATHRAVGLVSSVYQSIVAPFLKHYSAFGHCILPHIISIIAKTTVLFCSVGNGHPE